MKTFVWDNDLVNKFIKQSIERHDTGRWLGISKEIDNFIASHEFVWTDELVREFMLLIDSRKCLFNEYECGLRLKTFKKEHHSIPSGKGTANDVLNTEDEEMELYKRYVYAPTERGDFVYEGGKVVFKKNENGRWIVAEYPQPSANNVLNTEKRFGVTCSSETHHCINSRVCNELDHCMFEHRYSEFDKKVIKKYSDQIQPLNTERGWEIVSYKSSWSGTVYIVKDYPYIGGLSEHPIHSVKRLSDNEVFSVGDRLYIKSKECFNIGLDSFEICADRMCVKAGPYIMGLSEVRNISHAPTPSQPQNNKEKVTVWNFTTGKIDSLEIGNDHRLHWFNFAVKDSGISDEQKPYIIQAIENILNGEK